MSVAEKVERIAVIGAGTMGHGIAHVSATAGYETTLTDTKSELLPRALDRIKANLAGGVERGKLTADVADQALARIRLVDELAAAVEAADLVVEAIIEDLSAKRELFARLERLTRRASVLATNTSSLSIAQLAEATSRPGNVVGMHFFNPVHIMKLVEVVQHDMTERDAVDCIRQTALRMGKTPIVVRDSPGFASSRLGIVLGLEAMRMVEAGVASVEDIDRAMELGYGHPMGPLKVSDVVGLDVRLAIAEHLHRELKTDHYAPPEILRRKVESGQLGKKSGRGFYEWPKKQSS